LNKKYNAQKLNKLEKRLDSNAQHSTKNTLKTTQ